LKTTAEEIKRINPKIDVASLEIDTGKEESIVKAVEDTVKAFGSLDVAINNAGIAGPSQPSESVTSEAWKKVIDVNLNGVWMCQREEIKQMMKQE
jgi:NAD(P)-dependent dehydrogenase (short-subunit alcohol dehydrogenase family)